MDSAGKSSLGAIALGKKVLPFRFLGMGLYLAWLYSSHFSMALFPLSVDGGEVSLAFFVSNTVCAATLIACALCAGRLAPLTQRQATRWFSGIAAVAGTLVSAAHGALPFPPEAAIGLGSLLTGAATALLILMWSEFYANLPMRKVSIYYSASFILATALYYATSLLSPLAAILVTAALPALSVVMLTKSMAILPDSASEAHNESSERWTFPFRPVLLMAAYSFAFNFVRQSDGGTTSLGMLGVGLIAAVVLVANAFFFKRFDTRLLYRLSLPLMVAALLIQPLFGDEGRVIADVLANASYAGFVILTMIILSGICFRYGVAAIWLFGLTRGGARRGQHHRRVCRENSRLRNRRSAAGAAGGYCGHPGDRVHVPFKRPGFPQRMGHFPATR